MHRLGYGTMQLTGPGVWGPPADRDGAVRAIRRAVGLGVDLIDTADSYGPEVAEELVRQALHPYPAGVTVATKAGLTRAGPDQWEPCGRPDYLKRQCEGSLRRLGVDRIDLFQLHRVDPEVPADEQFGALRELRDAGMVTEVGLSEVTVDQIEQARRIVPVVSVQNQYNLAHARGRRRPRTLRTARDRIHPVVPAGQREALPRRRASRHHRPGARGDRGPGVPGLAAPSIPGDAAHPRHDRRSTIWTRTVRRARSSCPTPSTRN